MTIFWVTSFNRQIYEVSGKKLLDSFDNTNTEGTIFIGLEDGLEGFEDYWDDCINFNLNGSFWLQRWLKNNADISPPKPCLCKDPWARKEKDHVKNCPHTWFNRNTYRWIRKIATLYEALQGPTDGYNYLIWIDADCQFIDKLTITYIEDLFFENGRYDMCYLKSSKRTVLEAGFHAYDLRKVSSRFFLQDLFDCYDSGSFRKLARWDDSYVIQKILFGMDINKHDLAFGITENHAGVFGASLLQHHIIHNKGSHGRQYGIMR